MTMYPDGYSNSMISLGAMEAKHGPRMHPEFRRRFFAYMQHKQGLLGVGGGFRVTQPIKPGFAPPGKSFHENQSFASGIVAYSAVDLVKPNPFNSLAAHVAPAWADTADAPQWGLHTFISGEPWHIQCLEMRGWTTWVNNGRPDPGHFVLPGEPLPEPPIWEINDMELIYTPPAGSPANTPWLYQKDGSITYCTSAAHADATGRGVSVVALNAEQYPLARKAAGLA